MELTRVATRHDAEAIAFILRAVGIEAEIEPALGAVASGSGSPRGGGRSWILRVAVDEWERARRVLAEEDRPRRPARRRLGSDGPVDVPLHWLAILIAINVCVWLALEGTGGSESREALLRFGAAHAPSVIGGQWWRLVTAEFLHIGGRHLTSNMISLAVFGAFALRTWGVSRTFFIYVIAGIVGNLLSFSLVPSAAIKAGASGCIAGLIGALAGARAWRVHRDPESRFKTWHVIAAVVALYGFLLVGGATTDHLAHLGGLFGGAALGWMVPRPGQLHDTRERLIDRACAVTACALVGGSALFAFFA